MFQWFVWDFCSRTLCPRKASGLGNLTLDIDVCLLRFSDKCGQWFGGNNRSCGRRHWILQTLLEDRRIHFVQTQQVRYELHQAFGMQVRSLWDAMWFRQFRRRKQYFLRFVSVGIASRDRRCTCRRNLKSQGKEIIRDRVQPAFRKLRSFIELVSLSAARGDARAWPAQNVWVQADSRLPRHHFCDHVKWRFSRPTQDKRYPMRRDWRSAGILQFWAFSGILDRTLTSTNNLYFLSNGWNVRFFRPTCVTHVQRKESTDLTMDTNTTGNCCVGIFLLTWIRWKCTTWDWQKLHESK